MAASVASKHPSSMAEQTMASNEVELKVQILKSLETVVQAMVTHTDCWQISS